MKISFARDERMLTRVRAKRNNKIFQSLIVKVKAKQDSTNLDSN